MKIVRGDVFYVFPSAVKACGSEQINGRPAIIVSNNANNAFSTVVEVVYLTKQEKKPLPTHVKVNIKGTESTVLCEQIDSVSIEKLGKRIGRVCYKELELIDEALKVSLSLHT